MSEILYCANHPNRETSLRCNRCNKPICPSCAVRMPTGYRCKECVREGQKVFNTAQWSDYVLGFIVAAVLSGIAGALITLVGSLVPFFGWLVVVFASPFGGGLIAEVVRAVIRRRRAKSLFYTIAVGVVVGALPALLIQLFIGNLFGIIYQGIYLVLVVPSVFYRLSGIRLTR
jgi:hypothetical protein